MESERQKGEKEEGDGDDWLLSEGVREANRGGGGGESGDCRASERASIGGRWSQTHEKEKERERERERLEGE